MTGDAIDESAATNDPEVDAALRSLDSLTLRTASADATGTPEGGASIDLAHDVALVTQVHTQLHRRLTDLGA